MLRAGLFGRRPATWRSIARRIGVEPPAAIRAARSGIGRLTRAGMCIDAGGAALGTSSEPAASVTDAPIGPQAEKPKSESDNEVSGVLGASASGHAPALGLVHESDNGVPDALLAFLAVLLALAAAAALASRRNLVPAALLLGRDLRRPRKPVLFLEIEGVIAVRRLPGALPPGERHEFGYLQAYVPEHAAERVRALASRYEIVWATVWGDRANKYFVPLLGLEDDLPVLSFRSNGRWASSDSQIKTVDEAAGRRPSAWVHDHVTARHERWASARRAPTLLVQTDPHTGISEADVRRLLEWADGLAPTNGRRVERGRRTAGVLARS